MPEEIVVDTEEIFDCNIPYGEYIFKKDYD